MLSEADSPPKFWLAIVQFNTGNLPWLLGFSEKMTLEIILRTKISLASRITGHSEGHSAEKRELRRPFRLSSATVHHQEEI